MLDEMLELHNQMKCTTCHSPIKQPRIWMGVVAIQKYAIILRNVFIIKLLYELL